MIEFDRQKGEIPDPSDPQILFRSSRTGRLGHYTAALIEHFTPEEATGLARVAERISSKTVVVASAKAAAYLNFNRWRFQKTREERGNKLT